MGVGPGQISATLLYRGRPDPAPGPVLTGINDALAPFLLRFGEVPRAMPESMAFSDGALRIAVLRDTAPIDPASLAPVLAASYTRARPNDYSARVAAHSAALRLVVSDVRAARDEPVPCPTLIVVAHAAVAALAAQALPLVIHWRDTDMLILPAELPPIRGIGFPASLATRPDIGEAGRDAGGRPRFRIAAVRSERFFGLPVFVEPTSHPVDQVLALIDFCLLRRLAGEDLLTDGAKLGLPGPVEVHVRRLGPAPDRPLGAIALSLKAVLPRPQPRRCGAILSGPARARRAAAARVAKSTRA